MFGQWWYSHTVYVCQNLLICSLESIKKLTEDPSYEDNDVAENYQTFEEMKPINKGASNSINRKMENIHWNTDSPEKHRTNVKLKGRKEVSEERRRKQGMMRDRLESPEIYLISERKQRMECKKKAEK